MKRLLLLVLFLSTINANAIGQVKLYADVINSPCASTVDVPIRVKDYMNMLAMQGTVHWDVTKLSFASISNYGQANLSLTNGNFGFGSVGLGNLIFSWNDPDLSGESLPNQAILFTIRFNVVNSGSFNTFISFQNSPTQIEFINTTYAPIPFTATNGAVNISCGSCTISNVSAGTQSVCNPLNNQYSQQVTVTYSNAPSSGMLSVNNQLFPITSSPQIVTLSNLFSNGNPVNVNTYFTANPACQLSSPALFTAPTSCVPNPLEISAGNISSGCTGTVDIPIRVSDFNDILSMQGTIHWDQNFLSFNSIVNYGPSNLGLNNSNFGLGSTSSGNLLFSWNDNNLSGETVANATVLFTIRFNVVGAGNFGTAITFTNSPTTIEFVNTSYVPIPYATVDGLVDITCASCMIATAIPGNQSGCTASNNYYSQDVSIAYANAPQTGWLSVNNQLFAISGSPQTVALDSLISDGNPVNLLAFFTDDSACQLAINSLFTAPTSCETSNVTIYADIVSDSCTSFVDIPIRVADFTNMLTMQGTVHWDVSKLSFNSISSFGSPNLGLNNNNFGTANLSSGDLTFSWNDSDLSGETLPNSAVVFTLRLNVVGVGDFSSPITFTNSPTNMEFVDLSYLPISFTTTTGSVTIACPPANAIHLYIKEMQCSADSVFTIQVTANNFNNIVSYQSTIGWDPSLFVFDGINYFGPSNVLLNSINFGFSSVNLGILPFTWNDADLSGESVPDSTVLFSFQLHSILPFCCSNVGFVNSPTSTEFVDNTITTVTTYTHSKEICKCYNSYSSLEICAGDSVLIHGIQQNTSGIYIDTLINSLGCDSLIVVYLTVHSNTTSMDTQFACDSLEWIDGNTYYSNNNTATWILSNAMGCDSIITLNLTITSCEATVNVNAFIEGYYLSGSNPAEMYPAIYTNRLYAGSSNPGDPTDVDSVTVQLYEPFSPYSLLYSYTTMLNTAGQMTCVFPGTTVGNSYYIVLKQKNTIEIWSALPVLISSTTSYDFTTSASQAFDYGGDPAMKELEPGLFGLYSGDLNQDGFIDGFDYSSFLIDSDNSTNGSFELSSDMNGDGFVDAFDYPIYNFNNASGYFIQTPF